MSYLRRMDTLRALNTQTIVATTGYLNIELFAPFTSSIPGLPTQYVTVDASANSYVEFKVQNQSSGANARADICATSDIAEICMTAGSSNFTLNPALPYSGGCALFTSEDTTGGLAIASRGTTNGFIGFYTGGAAAPEQMRITDTGLVGIGTLTPSYRLDVNGSLNVQNMITAAGSSIIAAVHIDHQGGANDVWYDMLGGGGTVSITNPDVTSTSVILATYIGVTAGATALSVQPAAGSFMVTGDSGREFSYMVVRW